MAGETLQPLAGPSALRSASRAAAASVATVAALFCLVVGTLLVMNFARLAENDPLNEPVLTDLRGRYVRTPDDEALKARIREEDLRARQDYFTYQRRSGSAARLLLGGVLTLLTALGALALLRDEAPDVAGFGPPPSERTRRLAARRGLAAGALLLLVAVALAALLARSGPANRANPAHPPVSNPEHGTR